MRRFGLILSACLVLALASSFAAGATYYVATDGNDTTGDGSSGNPWATLQHGVDTIANGDTILVKPGTYDGCRIRISGASGSPKTLAAETAGTVLLNNPGAECRRPSIIEIISDDWGSTPTDYWVIEGFEVSGSPKWGIDGIRGGHATVRNNVVHDCGLTTGTTGIHLAYGDYMLVEDNVSYDNGEHGIYTNNGADYGIIRNNVMYGNASMGVHMNGDRYMEGSDGIMTGWLVEKNVSYSNGTQGFDGDGVEYTTWKNNLIYNNGSKGIHLTCQDGLVNPQFDNIYNNTIVVPIGAYYCVNFYLVNKNKRLPGGQYNEIKNNILYNDDITNSMRGSEMYISTWTSGWESDYNVVVDRFGMDDNATKYTLAEWQSTWGQDLNSTLCLDQYALFVDADAGDYHLKAGSPAIDAGTTLTEVTDDIEGASRPLGSAYDCGCYEAAGGPPPDLEITTTSLPNGQVNTSYSEQLAATGGVTPYSWSLYSGSLPAGLNLSTSGLISGTPTTEETANFTVQATDSQEPADTDTQALSITVDPEPSAPTITTTSLPDCTKQVPYSEFVEATGGTTPYTWSITAGSLPKGLALNESTGEISGTPLPPAGTSEFTVRCTDDASQYDEKALSITMN